jgi:hypothetical protein
MKKPLLPLMNESPYWFVSLPFTYSSVCSREIFINWSMLVNIPIEEKLKRKRVETELPMSKPRYSMPEFNLTRTGLPRMTWINVAGINSSGDVGAADMKCKHKMRKEKELRRRWGRNEFGMDQRNRDCATVN